MYGKGRMTVGMKGSKQTTPIDTLLWLFLTLDTLLGAVQVCEKSFFTAFDAPQESIKSSTQIAHQETANEPNNLSQKNTQQTTCCKISSVTRHFMMSSKIKFYSFPVSWHLENELYGIRGIILPKLYSLI